MKRTKSSLQTQTNTLCSKPTRINPC